MPAPSQKSSTGVLGGGLLLVATFFATFAFGSLCGYFYHHYNTTSSQDGGSFPSSTISDGDNPPPLVTALGRIEPRDGIIPLGVAAPDRIAKILVEEGQRVTSGQRLVELESEILRRLEERLAEIQQKEAEKRLEAIKASGKSQIRMEEIHLQQVKQLSPLEMEAQQRKIEYLERQANNAKNDFGRLEKVGDTIAEQEKEKQKLLWQQAEAELTAAKTQYQRLLTGQPLDFQLGEARLTAARAELERSRSTISHDLLDNQTSQAKVRGEAARVVAPSDGTVLRLLAHRGELVQGRPIVQMANLDEMIVIAEVPISSRPRVHPKDRATITSSVFEELGYKELKGEVYAIGNIVGRPKVTSLDPLASVDYRMVEVKILLNQREPAVQYIGHEVNVTIHPNKPSRGQR
jgi:HlyD family secretion protein